MSEEIADLLIRLRGDSSQYVSAMEAGRRASRETRAASDQVTAANNRQSRSHRSLAGSLHLASAASLVSVGAVVAGLGSAVKSAANFDVTIRQIAVATNSPISSMKELSDLAIKMGQDTIYSAQDASAAMLELAKSGMTAADLKAGALSSTLTLASAGSLELASAAGYITSGLALFNLTADKSSQVAAALAGAANASKASVQDMGLALSQVGPGAESAGLSLQQTTAVLAAFAQNGIEGSDAGTSLKTMLARLTPQTDKAKGAMEDLGLKFTDAKGNFIGIDQVAQQLHDRLGTLSPALRTTALNTIFGSDASRAALILSKEGAAGIRDLTRATSDQTQAQKLAAATTSGSAGAMSQLSGSLDTAKLMIGEALTPLVIDLSNHMTSWTNTVTKDVIPAVAHFVTGMENGTGPGGQFAGVLGDIGDAAKGAWHVAEPIFSFIGDHPHLFAEAAKDAALMAVSLKAISTVKKLPGLGGLLGGGGSSGGGLGGVSGLRPVPVYVVSGPGGKTGPGGLGGPVGGGGALGGGLTTAAAVTNAPLDLTGIKNLAKDPKVLIKLGFTPATSKVLADYAATRRKIRADDQLEDPRRAAAAAASAHKAALGYAGVAVPAAATTSKDVTSLLSGGFATVTAAGASSAAQLAAGLGGTVTGLTGGVKTLKDSLDGLNGSATFRVNVVDQLGRPVVKDSGGTYVQGRNGRLGLDVAGGSSHSAGLRASSGVTVVVQGSVIGTSTGEIARSLEPHITTAQNQRAGSFGNGATRNRLALR